MRNAWWIIIAIIVVVNTLLRVLAKRSQALAKAKANAELAAQSRGRVAVQPQADAPSGGTMQGQERLRVIEARSPAPGTRPAPSPGRIAGAGAHGAPRTPAAPGVPAPRRPAAPPAPSVRPQSPVRGSTPRSVPVPAPPSPRPTIVTTAAPAQSSAATARAPRSALELPSSIRVLGLEREQRRDRAERQPTPLARRSLLGGRAEPATTAPPGGHLRGPALARSLADPRNARLAFVFAEVLGRPVGDRAGWAHLPG